MTRMRTHSDAVNAVRITVSDLGGIPIKFTNGMFRQMDGERPIRIGEPGISDVLACIGGVFFGIEIKFTNTDVLSAAQRRFRDAVEAAGGKWILADFRHGQDGCEMVRKGVHYSTAQTRSNIDASLQKWCQHYGFTIGSRPADHLAQMLTPGCRYAD